MSFDRNYLKIVRKGHTHTHTTQTHTHTYTQTHTHTHATHTHTTRTHTHTPHTHSTHTHTHMYDCLESFYFQERSQKMCEIIYLFICSGLLQLRMT